MYVCMFVRMYVRMYVILPLFMHVCHSLIIKLFHHASCRHDLKGVVELFDRRVFKARQLKNKNKLTSPLHLQIPSSTPASTPCTHAIPGRQGPQGRLCAWGGVMLRGSRA